MKCGVVALAGRPNVGKSSLVNALLKARVAIVSPKPQTTRNAVRCVYNDDNAQIVFTDTPGLYRPKEADKLGRFLNESAAAALEDADVVCWLVEAGDKKLLSEDREAARVLAEAKKPVVLVANKADASDPRSGVPTAPRIGLPTDPQEAFRLYEPFGPFVAQLAVSAKLNQGLDRLVEELLPLLPEGEPWYDPDVLMDSTERFMAAETIRGKVLSLLRDEVPHCTAVEIEAYKSPEEYPDRKRLYIRASLIVETEGQKAILIGAGGKMIKRIGQSARADLEELTGWPVYLELWAKVSPHWRQTDLVLRRLGYGAAES
ncbi:MAG: GTPase Era [Synergistaceae bacterium]|nr:GTPase Era [Synergistaceae bacterium]